MTIQVGNFANYIGSHFWNFQDELIGLAEDPHGDQIYRNSSLNMDILYRAGETDQGILTYNPRLMSVGLQGYLGCLNHGGSLYSGEETSDSSDVITWSGNITRYESKPVEKNLFLQSLCEEQDAGPARSNGSNFEGESNSREIHDTDRIGCLENGVQYWTDFSKVQYHHRSLYELHGSWTDPNNFDNYQIGKDVLAEGFQGDEFNERLRMFIEECDHIQGIQFIVDDSGGFSGVASEFLENIADEYSNTPVLLYAARDQCSYLQATSRKHLISRSLHDAVSFSKLSSYCKLMVPVGLPSLSESKLSSILNIEDQKLFHSSAVYAAALHSISLPFRMDLLSPSTNTSSTSGAVDINEMVQFLAGKGRQNMVAALDVSMPAPSLTGSFFRSMCSLTPDIEDSVDDSEAVESLIMHGMFHSAGRRASLSEVNESICKAYEHENLKPKFSHVALSLCPLPIPLPFPSIFKGHVGKQGEYLSSTQSDSNGRKGSLDIDSIPMAARLSSSTVVKPLIEKKLASLCKYGMERGAEGSRLLQNWGFGRDEVEEMGEVLSKMVMQLNLHPQYSSDSD